MVRVTLAAAVMVLGAGFIPAQAVSASAACVALAENPTPDELFDKAIKAVGGKEAVDAIKSLHAKMQAEMMGMELQMENKWSRAGGRLHKIVLPFGETLMGTDGKVKWKQDMMGYALLEGDEAKQFDNQADFFGVVLDPKTRAKRDAKSMEVKGKETFEGVECFRLNMIGSDDEVVDLFFNAETGLPMGSRQKAETEMGPMTSTALFAEWKPEAGVKFFRTIKIKTDNPMMPEMELKITTLEVNKLSDDAFALPEEVKKLHADKDKPKPAEPEVKLEDLPSDQREQAKMIIGQMTEGGAAAIKQQLPQLEQGVRYAPEELRTMLKYIVQELKKELTRLEGGGK